MLTVRHAHLFRKGAVIVHLIGTTGQLIDLGAMEGILGVAYAGAAFGLSLLVFWLLWRQIHQPNPSVFVGWSIRIFMLLIFVMGAMAIGAQLASVVYAPTTTKELDGRVEVLEKLVGSLGQERIHGADQELPVRKYHRNEVAEDVQAALCPPGTFVSGIEPATAFGSGPAVNGLRELYVYCSPIVTIAND